MESIILNLSNEANANAFAKLLNAGILETEYPSGEVIFSLHVYEADVPEQNLDVFKFISKSLLRSSDGFFYYGPDPAVSLITISEINYEDRPYFYDVFRDNISYFVDILSKEFSLKIDYQTFGGRFGKHINLYIDLNLVNVQEFVEFIRNDSYEFVFEAICDLVVSHKEYHNSFRELIYNVGGGRFTDLIIECYCGQSKNELLDDLKNRIGNAVNFFISDFDDIYYYLSHY